MKELDFLKTICDTLSDSSLIGDDCAYLSDLNVVVTHDTFVQDVHFSLDYSSPYQVAYKSIIANISDILAAGAIIKYLTISLSLPPSVGSDFVQDFYYACDDLAKEYGFKVIGGDLTGAEKIVVSICAIGSTLSRKVSSRGNAKPNDVVIVSGEHGSSAAGLWLLNNNIHGYTILKDAHKIPRLSVELSKELATLSQDAYAMMDSSDGLADALYKISEASDVSISVQFDKIPFDADILTVAQMAGVDYRDWILYGGEDYKLVACVSESDLVNIKSEYYVIGKVVESNVDNLVRVMYPNNSYEDIDLSKTYNHFKE